jgi:serine/threonine-protein kinase
LEAEVVASLRHPNIVQIYDSGQQDGRLFYSLELIDGGNLAQKVKGRPLPPCEAAQLVETLARAMHAAHGQGIIHRDLKPANVLLTPDGTPKITDFGLAKRMDDELGLSRTGDVLGTANYMAPEQAEGDSCTAGPPADVYALGAILYELLTGEPPFKGKTSAQVLEQVRKRRPVPPAQLQPGVPRDLQAICLKCLEKKPSARHASAAALAADLRGFLSAAPGGNPAPAGFIAACREWCCRPQRMTEVGAATVATALALTVWMLLMMVMLPFLNNPQIRRDEALLQLLAVICGFFLPVVPVGLGAIRKTRSAIWAGLILNLFNLCFCLACLAGLPFDLAGMLTHQALRTGVFSLFAVLSLVAVHCWAIALVACSAERKRK